MIPADLAAEILFRACYSYGDIEDKSVVDLGTGTGRLAVGAVILGAKYTVGVDIDRNSVAEASRGCRGQEVDWVVGDISTLHGRVDTVLMNPPFGTKRPHADLAFLETAINLGEAVYSIHKSATRLFIKDWLRKHKASYETMLNVRIGIGHQFDFHRKSNYQVEVEVYRIRPAKT